MKSENFGEHIIVKCPKTNKQKKLMAKMVFDKC